MRRRFLRYRSFAAALRRLKHPAILRKIDNRAQKFFCARCEGGSSAPSLDVKNGGEAALN